MDESTANRHDRPVPFAAKVSLKVAGTPRPRSASNSFHRNDSLPAIICLEPRRNAPLVTNSLQIDISPTRAAPTEFRRADAWSVQNLSLPVLPAEKFPNAGWRCHSHSSFLRSVSWIMLVLISLSHTFPNKIAA